MVGRVEPSQDDQRVAALGSMTPRQRFDIGAVSAHPQRCKRHHEQRPRGLDRRRDQPLGGDDLETGGKIETPAQPCLGDQGIEHRSD
jgi:hypothetical protein